MDKSKLHCFQSIIVYNCAFKNRYESKSNLTCALILHELGANYKDTNCNFLTLTLAQKRLSNRFLTHSALKRVICSLAISTFGTFRALYATPLPTIALWCLQNSQMNPIHLSFIRLGVGIEKARLPQCKSIFWIIKCLFRFVV